jgi:hypothetical protein
MPETPGEPDAPLARLQWSVERTRTAAGLPFRRRDASAVFAGVTAGYLLAYLSALGHLAPGLGGVGVTVAPDPLGTLLRPALGPLSFTPVARVRLGPLTYLFSFNTVVGVGLAGLVGLNLSLSYLAWTRPTGCGIGRSSTGALAAVPALLSGSACCGPVVLLAVGTQASGALLTAFQFLLPAAVALLLASLVVVGRQIDPAVV